MERNLSEVDVGEVKPSYTKGRRRQQRWCENDVPISLRPIRLIQLILDVMLFSLTIHLWTRSNNPMGTVYSIILMILFASFAVLMSIDAVGQIGGCLTPDLPMLLVAFTGLVLFTIAAQVVYLLLYPKNSSTLVLILLCLVAALLFLIDATIMIMFWRYMYVKKGRCFPCRPGESMSAFNEKQTHDEPSRPLEPRLDKSNPVTRNVSTSVSRHSATSFYSGLFSSRSNNRIGVEHRRQYVDAQTDPRSNPSLNLPIETQTQKVESTERVDHETSATAVVEEKQIQTLSECPICSAVLDQSPEGICPSFLALYQSFGMFSCDKNPQTKPAALTLVDRGTLPESNSSLETTKSTILVNRRPLRVYETRACPTHGAGLIAQKAGLPNPVTRVSLPHCIRKNKRTQTPASKPVAVRDEHQNTEIDEKKSEIEQPVVSVKCDAQESTATTVNNSISEEKHVNRENSTIGSITSAGNSSTERSSGLTRTRSTVKESKERSYQSLAQGIFIMQRSSDDVSVPARDTSRDKSTSKENVPEKSEKIESMTTTGTSPIRLPEIPLDDTLIHPAQTSRHNTDFRELTRPTVVCHCPQYYYKDVFGRHICGQCAHKHLIKIPYRFTVKPVGDMRCCSCSQAIIYQTPNTEQKTCGTSCKCRYQMHRTSK